jgi:hypothetical protein
MGTYLGISFLVVGSYGILGEDPLPGTAFLVVGFLLYTFSRRG